MMPVPESNHTQNGILCPLPVLTVGDDGAGKSGDEAPGEYREDDAEDDSSGQSEPAGDELEESGATQGGEGGGSEKPKPLLEAFDELEQEEKESILGLLRQLLGGRDPGKQ